VIKYLLQELEKSRNPVFSKKELLNISRPGFEELRRRHILSYVRPSGKEMESLRLPRCQHGCYLTVIEMDGDLEAVCLNHPEENPIPVDRDDLNRYAFLLDKFLFQVRAANGIEGDFHRISGGYFYIGYKTYDNSQVGFVFISNIGSDRLIKLSGLKCLCEEDDILVVLTPFSKIDDVLPRGRLHHDKIIQASLANSLNLQTFELPIEKLISRVLNAKAGEETTITELSKKQKEDYEKFEYQCYDNVHVPGTIPMKRSSFIEVNGNKIKIGDSIFALLLRFVAELKQEKGGWVNRYDLESDGIVTDPEKFQIYSNLRTALEGSLLDKDGHKFMQNDGSKNYRISTHPDFVTYHKKKLLNHQDHRIRRIALGMP
jgi:hypothetical protein